LTIPSESFELLLDLVSTIDSTEVRSIIIEKHLPDDYDLSLFKKSTLNELLKIKTKLVILAANKDFIIWNSMAETSTEFVHSCENIRQICCSPDNKFGIVIRMN
jgi:hypothetical protein